MYVAAMKRIALIASSLLLAGVACLQSDRPVHHLDGETTSPPKDTSGAEDTAVSDSGPTDTGGGDVGDGCGPEQCHISGACVPAGMSRPEVPCYACLPEVRRDGWSRRPGGTPCDDGDPCTPTSACEAGTCVGVPEAECLEAPECVASVDCTGGHGCRYVLEPGTCLIDGVCYAGEQTGPAGPCTICDSAEPRIWTSLHQVPCDDGDPCTEDGTCELGTCLSKPRCKDTLACTEDLCDGGECSFPVKPGACLIGGVCYASGDEDPTTPCKVCAPAAPGAWTPLDGDICDDGDVCTATGSCRLGVCDALRLHLDEEPNDQPSQAQDLGIPSGVGETSVAGNLNPLTDDVDWFASDLPGRSADEGGWTIQGKLLGQDNQAAHELCVFLECFPIAGTIDATLPSLDTCDSGASGVQFEGRLAGCCRVGSGAIEVEVSGLCPVPAGAAQGRALVRVRAPSPGHTAVADCASYTLTVEVE